MRRGPRRGGPEAPLDLPAADVEPHGPDAALLPRAVGGLGFLKQWIADHLDHACLFAKSDPIREQLLKDYPKLFRPLVIESVSTEGIAQHLFETFDPMVRKETAGRAWVRQIILHEDTKNKASYQPKV